MTIPKLFRVTVEVGDLDVATELYRGLFGDEGERHRGARHYFDCGGMILALIDVSQGGLTPTPGPKSLYFAVDDVEARARAGEPTRRPRSLPGPRRAARVT